jgi:hypothetical protein
VAAPRSEPDSTSISRQDRVRTRKRLETRENDCNSLQRQSGLLARRLQSRRVTHVSLSIPEPQTTSAGLPRLERQAGRITEDLRQLHWDNCKVSFDRRLAYRYALRALRDGYDAAKILKCYERALQECHALATDRTASRGQICRFELSSTVRRANRFLANNRLPTAERIRRAIEPSTEGASVVPIAAKKADLRTAGQSGET